MTLTTGLKPVFAPKIACEIKVVNKHKPVLKFERDFKSNRIHQKIEILKKLKFKIRAREKNLRTFFFNVL